MEDLTSPRVLRETLARYGLTPRKSLGQNFLIDGNLRNKIVDTAALRDGVLALEVGPGPGGLTSKLLETGAAVLAIEADPGMARVLTELNPAAPDRLVVINADVLNLDLAQIVAAEGLSGRPCVAVANLPYYITTPVIFQLLDTDLPWQRMVFLVQREVAERIVAPPGSKAYGLLSVMTQYRAAAEIVTIMPASVFWPPPKVQSALIRLTIQSDRRLTAEAEGVFFGLVRAAFGQRRKTLANACRVWAETMGIGGEFESLCRTAGINPGARGETLSLGEFLHLVTVIVAAGNKQGLQ